jgi:hypothetical protein
MTSSPTAVEAASSPSRRCSANRARCLSRRPASRSASPSVAVSTSRSRSGSVVVSSAATGVCESCIRGPPPRTWPSWERPMSDAPGRTPPQNPRTQGQPQPRRPPAMDGACQVDCQPLALTPFPGDSGGRVQAIYLYRWTAPDGVGRAGKLEVRWSLPRSGPRLARRRGETPGQQGTTAVNERPATQHCPACRRTSGDRPESSLKGLFVMKRGEVLLTAP